MQWQGITLSDWLTSDDDPCIQIQPPLDVSSDSAGGIGRMLPATLLLHDEFMDFVHLYLKKMMPMGVFLEALCGSQNRWVTFGPEILQSTGMLKYRSFWMPCLQGMHWGGESRHSAHS